MERSTSSGSLWIDGETAGERVGGCSYAKAKALAPLSTMTIHKGGGPKEDHTRQVSTRDVGDFVQTR